MMVSLKELHSAIAKPLRRRPLVERRRLHPNAESTGAGTREILCNPGHSALIETKVRITCRWYPHCCEE